MKRTVDDIIADAAVLEGETFQYNKAEIDADVSREMASVFEGLGVRILSVVGGFIGCAFFIGFLVLLGVLSDSGGTMVIGAVLLAGSVMLNFFTRSRFLDGVAIALFVSGIALLSFGLDQGARGLAFLYIILSVAVFSLARNQLLMFLSVGLFFGSMLLQGYSFQSYFTTYITVALLVAAYTVVNLAETAAITAGTWLNIRHSALRGGLLFSFAAVLVFVVRTDIYLYYLGHSWIMWCIIMIALLAALWQVMKSLGLALKTILGFGLALIALMLPCLFFPAIPGAILILLVSAHTRHRTGLGVGIVTLVYFVSRYYYDMQLTLLIKSLILLGSGLLFLAGWYLFKKYNAVEKS